MKKDNKLTSIWKYKEDWIGAKQKYKKKDK